MRTRTNRSLDHDDIVDDITDEHTDEHTDLEREAEMMLDGARDQSAEAMESAADGVSRASRNVIHRVARAADRTASALETSADYVRDHDSKEVLQDVSDLAKRHPGTALAAAALVGFFLGRAMTRTSV